MEIKKNIALFLQALLTLEDGIDAFLSCKVCYQKQPTEENERWLKIARDSLIQRFEYCMDLFWKTVKLYLEETINVSFTGIISSRGVLREAFKARLLSEEEGSRCMDMVEARNKTSYTYHELLADEVAHEIPQYYELMKHIVDRMQDDSDHS
ncbi:MAG TPA: HI0074 family nucleotidyltransferase substrate-binding subunit [Candidatus Babeliales bacterium]|jgi:nucleotidyltransferase substrate binding protein (TIGR01987 family)|nr:HI0074 family nucleotidyltransferase substrate-binding subunit [Candidatus Babeliales bacterium]